MYLKFHYQPKSCLWLLMLEQMNLRALYLKPLKYYLTQFWLTHFNLASSTNGIQNKGTKETPVLKLIDKCIHMTNTKINRTIYDISQEVNDDQSKIKVKINDKEKLIGKSIYNSSKEYLKKK